MEFFDLVWIDIALKRPLLGGLFFTALLSFLPRSMSASLIGRLGSSAFRLPIDTVSMSLTGSRFSSESAPGRSIMGFENEADQSLGRLRHSMNSGSKRTCDLTSFIVPRGTSCHRAVEFGFSPIGFDFALSCR
jgi:hypothetical protein